MVDFERIGAVGGLLLSNLIMLHWMTGRLTRERAQQNDSINLLVLEVVGLRNDLTRLLVDEKLITNEEAAARSIQISETVNRLHDKIASRID